jgi:hypothetical protein
MLSNVNLSTHREAIMPGDQLSSSLVKLQSRREVSLAYEAFSAAFKINFPSVLFSLVPGYLEKQTFGEMVVVIAGDKMPDGWPEMINDMFDCKETFISKIGQSLEPAGDISQSSEELLHRTFCFNMGAVKVDLVSVRSDELHFAYRYLAFGDMGRLLGKVFRRLGVRYGMKGMKVNPLDSNGKEMAKHRIRLTLDHAEALEFAGYDVSRFDMGFRSLEDVFEYVASSPFFHPDFFFEHTKKNPRGKDGLVPEKSYQRFLAWCQKNKSSLSYSKKLTSEEARKRVFEHYPWALKACEDRVKGLRQRPGSKFNGKLISNVTGIHDGERTQVARFAKKSFASEKDFQAWILSASDAEVENWFSEEYQHYLKSKNPNSA